MLYTYFALPLILVVVWCFFPAYTSVPIILSLIVGAYQSIEYIQESDDQFVVMINSAAEQLVGPIATELFANQNKEIREDVKTIAQMVENAEYEQHDILEFMRKSHQENKMSIINDSYDDEYYSLESLVAHIEINLQLINAAKYKREFNTLKSSLIANIKKGSILSEQQMARLSFLETSKEDSKILIFTLNSDGTNSKVHFEYYYCRFKRFLP